jgi:CBS domain-containing protein
MKVKEIMEPAVIIIKSDATYEEAARILYQNEISGAPVVDGSGKVVGIVSEEDLFRIVYPYYLSYYDHPEMYIDYEDRERKMTEIKNHKVEIFMSKNVVGIDPEPPVLQAGAVMLARDIMRMPVIKDGQLVGIVNRKTIYHAVLKNNFKL